VLWCDGAKAPEYPSRGYRKESREAGLRKTGKRGKRKEERE